MHPPLPDRTGSPLFPYVLAAGSGLLLILVFPSFLQIDLGPLAFLALVPLLLSLPEATSPQAFWRGAVAGAVAYPGILYWIVYCMVTYANMSRPLAWLILFLLVAILAAYLGLFAVLCRLLTRRAGFHLLAAAPLAWVTVELFRTYFPFGGFPWALLGLSQHAFLPVIQIAEFTGIYGVSFLIVLVNSALALMLQRFLSPSPRPLFPRGEVIVAAVLLVADIGFGFFRMHQVDAAFGDRPKLRLALVQGNIDQGVKWEESVFWQNLEIHLALSRRLLEDQPDLLLWPEAALTVFFNEHFQVNSEVVQKLQELNTYFLVGSLSREVSLFERHYFNSAYLLAPHAREVLGRYDKIHLVPFGEYVPLQRLFFFADAIAHGNTGNTTPGRSVVVFNPPGYRFACVICYEVIYGNLDRKFVNQGAQFLTTITNDAWFGRTSAPYQHHANLVFRAVENRVYFARAANTGISSLVNPVGRVEVASEIFEPAGLSVELRLGPAWTTFYTRAGDVFAYLCGLTVLAGVGYGLRRRSKKIQTGSASGTAD